MGKAAWYRTCMQKYKNLCKKKWFKVKFQCASSHEPSYIVFVYFKDDICYGLMYRYKKILFMLIYISYHMPKCIDIIV